MVSSSASVRTDVGWSITTGEEAAASVERLMSGDGVLRWVERVWWTRSIPGSIPSEGPAIAGWGLVGDTCTFRGFRTSTNSSSGLPSWAWGCPPSSNNLFDFGEELVFRESIGEIVRDNTIIVNIGEGQRVSGRPTDMVNNK